VAFLVVMFLGVLTGALEDEIPPWGKVMSIPGMFFAVVFIILVGLWSYSALCAFTSGVLFWCSMAALLAVAQSVFLDVWDGPAATILLHAFYALTVVWRLYYGAVLLSLVYRNRCSAALVTGACPLAPTGRRGAVIHAADLVDRLVSCYRTSALFRLLALFSYDAIHFTTAALVSSATATQDPAVERRLSGIVVVFSTVIFVTLPYYLVVVFHAAAVTRRPVPPQRFFIGGLSLEIFGLLAASLTRSLLQLPPRSLVLFTALLNGTLLALTLWRHSLLRRVAL